jgi:AI-2 transport protein TqsA
LVALACLVVFLAGLKAAEAFFVPVLFALFLAVLFLPVLGWLRARLPDALALVLTLLAAGGIVFGLAWILLLSVEQVVELVPRYEARFAALEAEAAPWLASLGLEVTQDTLAQHLSAERLMGLLTAALARASALAWFLVLVLLLTVFTWVESLGFASKLATVLGGDGAVARFGRIQDDIQRYLVIKTAVSLAMGVVIGLWLWGVGVDLPVLWGLIAFLLNYIPNVGSIAAAVPPAVLALVQLGPGAAVATVVGFLLANLVIGNILEPNLMGRGLGLAPIVVLLSLVFWGFLWGMVGTLLAVPLTMLLKIALENSRRLSWMARMMAPAGSLAGARARAVEED